jgi:pentose-5-phosphate-3-epimerase
MVKNRLRPILGDKAAATECITLYFNHHLMEDNALFYADHFMMLPVWVQILLHSGENADVPKAIERLRRQGTPEA